MFLYNYSEVCFPLLIFRVKIFKKSKMNLFCKFVNTGVLLHMTSKSIQCNVSHRCYVQTYIFQSSHLSKRKLLNLKHFKRFSTDSIKIKAADAAKQATKIKQSRNNEFQRLFLLAAPEKWRLVGAITCLLISSTITMAVPFSLGKVIDIIYQKDQKDTKENLDRVCLLLFGIFLFGGLCNFGRVYFLTTTGHKITQSLRKKAYAAILSQETAMFDKVSTGELVGRLSGN